MMIEGRSKPNIEARLIHAFGNPKSKNTSWNFFKKKNLVISPMISLCPQIEELAFYDCTNISFPEEFGGALGSPPPPCARTRGPSPRCPQGTPTVPSGDQLLSAQAGRRATHITAITQGHHHKKVCGRKRAPELRLHMPLQIKPNSRACAGPATPRGSDRS